MSQTRPQTRHAWLRRPFVTFRLAIFWLALAAFFAWDWSASRPINHRKEPAVLAVGSGQTPSGGHCSAF